jgi:site-specific DNA recombinase
MNTNDTTSARFLSPARLQSFMDRSVAKSDEQCRAGNLPRVAIYTRVSTDRQEEEGTSLDTQEDRARAHCEARGYAVAGVYRETYSGFELRRPQLDRLREAVRARTVDVVVCYVVDRLSRNQAHTAILLQEMDDAGVRYEFVAETFEATAVGKFILSAKAFAAEIEREKIIERTQRGRRARVEAGKLSGFGPAPYGYQWNADRSGLDINPATAPIARRIFARLMTGASLHGIAGELTRDHIPPPGKSPIWRPPTIRAILRNPVYAGRAQAYRWESTKRNGKITTRERPEAERIILPSGTAPALVTEEVWQAAQAVLAFNCANRRREPMRPEAYLLRLGYVVCGYCGSPLAVGGTGGRLLYRCSRSKCSPWACQFRGSISAVKLDADVWRRVERTLRNPELIAAQLEALDRRPDPSEHELSAIMAALASVDRQQANLINSLALVSGGAAELIAGKLNALDHQRRQLEEERERVEIIARRHQEARDRARDLVAYCRRVAAKLKRATYPQKRLALAALGVRVTVYDKTVKPCRYRVEAEIPLDSGDLGDSSDDALDDALLVRSGRACGPCRGSRAARAGRW